ncbi:hypothetical protein [Xanthomonas tesorieronis]|uniref:hypothetical protein n=1 Tax=Xanthomonas tesorieronis TaxID=3160839 RepID=UPI003515283C
MSAFARRCRLAAERNRARAPPRGFERQADGNRLAILAGRSFLPIRVPIAAMSALPHASAADGAAALADRLVHAPCPATAAATAA